MLTADEARRIARNIARLRELLGNRESNGWPNSPAMIRAREAEWG
jgi:hypothetical protein